MVHEITDAVATDLLEELEANEAQVLRLMKQHGRARGCLEDDLPTIADAVEGLGAPVQAALGRLAGLVRDLKSERKKAIDAANVRATEITEELFGVEKRKA